MANTMVLFLFPFLLDTNEDGERIHDEAFREGLCKVARRTGISVNDICAALQAQEAVEYGTTAALTLEDVRCFTAKLNAHRGRLSTPGLVHRALYPETFLSDDTVQRVLQEAKAAGRFG